MATFLRSSEQINRRYLIESQLGEGGMGQVYLAVDRLTGQTVALKRVTALVEELMFSSRDTSTDARVALAREFKVLASLRHPNIITVLNYGFDEQSQPFITMEYLPDAESITHAARQRSLEEKIDLLIQLLQALIYLHRRGILHRDLKPANVMVTAGDQVKVLDFGLATEPTEVMDVVGTLPYMAPEVLQDEHFSIKSDLYAVGVMAYQMFTGLYPFAGQSSTALIHSILNELPDLNILNQAIYKKLAGTDEIPEVLENFQYTLPVAADVSSTDVPPADLPPLVGKTSSLTLLVGRLLAKDPTARYDDASAAIKDLCTAIGRPLPPETAEIRESFLQAARFVGRKAELKELQAAHDHMRAQKSGSVWLVGGESGVGKSRLLDELYAVALVEGTVVLRGQARSEGQVPYEVWRDILRWVTIATDISDFEASVLKMLVPDIETLLETEVADPPRLDPLAAQDRLLIVIENLFARLQAQPLMLILEDLQWSGSESLGLIKRLQQSIDSLPLMIVGSYRNDEAPDLPHKLGKVQVMKLQRLASPHIAELSTSILGEAGRQPELVKFLDKETEGNVFFLVEVVRTLAEEAGQLERITDMTLPASVSAGGIARIIQRRLSFVDDAARPLLHKAAVMGRQLDLTVLAELAGAQDLDRWLNVAANSAILEVQGGAWRFSHDKLREGLRDQIAPNERSTLHREVATAIEAIYQTPAEIAEQAARLAYHWQVAGNRTKEARYSFIAGEQALRSGAYQEARDLLSRAKTLLDYTAEINQAELELMLGDAYLGLGQIATARQHFEQCLRLQGKPIPKGLPRLILGLMSQAGRQFLHRVLPGVFVGRKSADDQHVLEQVIAYYRLAELYYHEDRTLWTLYTGFRSLNLSETYETTPELARSYATMSIVAGTTPLRGLAEKYTRWAFEITEKLDSPRTLGFVSMATGVYRNGVAHWEAIQRDVPRGLEALEKIGDWRTWGQAMIVLASASHYEGHFRRSADQYRQLWEIGNRSHDLQLMAWGRGGQGQNALRLGQVDEAIAYLQDSLTLFAQISDSSLQLRSLGLLTLACLYKRQFKRAEATAADAWQLIEAQPLPSANGRFEGYRGVTELAMAQWEAQPDDETRRKQARQALRGLHRFASVFPFGQATASCWQGVYHWRTDQPDKAQAAWDKALEQADTLQMPYETGLIHYHRGRLTGSADDLRQAVAIFDELEAAFDRQRAEDALAALDQAAGADSDEAERSGMAHV